MTILPALRRAAAPLVTYALPPRCPACGAIVGADHIFCLPCWNTMRFLGDPSCARCGTPFELPQGEGAQCAACLASPPAFDRARAVIAYDEVARQVAMKLKYGRRIGLARLIAALLERHVPVGDRSSMLLVPVPLHRWRLWSRGFNQSALIADDLGRRTAIAADRHLLLRDRRTPPLRGMNPTERRRTVRGAFALRAGADIRGRTILLIDDVLTSGATADACARLLKRGGAASVQLLCWAKVVADEGARPQA